MMISCMVLLASVVRTDGTRSSMDVKRGRETKKALLMTERKDEALLEGIQDSIETANDALARDTVVSARTQEDARFKSSRRQRRNRATRLEDAVEPDIVGSLEELERQDRLMRFKRHERMMNKRILYKPEMRESGPPPSSLASEEKHERVAAEGTNRTTTRDDGTDSTGDVKDTSGDGEATASEVDDGTNGGASTTTLLIGAAIVCLAIVAVTMCACSMLNTPDEDFTYYDKSAPPGAPFFGTI